LKNFMADIGRKAVLHIKRKINKETAILSLPLQNPIKNKVTKLSE